MKKLLNPSRLDWSEVCRRPGQDMAKLERLVLEVFEAVAKNGDEALVQYTTQFDGVDITDFRISGSSVEEAERLVNDELKNAIKTAYSNIYKFHEAQQTEPVVVDTMDGVRCWQDKRPIEKVGLYIPGGTAPLFSTILMLAIPAKLAGCKEVVLCTPPDSNGLVNPAILYTAALCGVENIYRVGGIQAIAAMTYGTETIPKVYKIFGPGNQYVTAAKQVSTRYNVAIDMPAGPSELLVLADQSANPSYVASDLLSQAEHGADSQVVLVTTNEEFLQQVEYQLEKQIRKLPRKDIAQKSIDNSRLIWFPNKELALEFINEYGPEHFILSSDDEKFYLQGIVNAGSVFIGNYTPESAGDYASGTNHTLPTQGYSKQYSGVNLDSFLKSITFQKISPEGLQKIGKAIEIMAAAEGLDGHKNAVSLRLKDIEENQ